MRLRARFALMALILMLVPTVALSVITLDSRISGMVDDMSRQTDFMISQIFEQVRLALAQGGGDVPAAMRDNQPLRKLLDSTVAFGPAVVAASIVGIDGTVIVAANGDGEGKPALNLPSVTELNEQASRWLLFTSLPGILTAKVYEAQRRVEINGRPVATISVGVTTALIADRARHLLVVIVATAGLVVAAAMFVVLLVSSQILEQLAILSHGFEQLAAGNSPQEVKVSGVNELGTLAEKFNELSRQVRADRSRLDSDQTHLFDVVRSIQDAVVLLDANRVVLFANKEAQERLAARNEALEGLSMTSVLGPDHPLLALVESTTTGTEAHDVPLTLPAGGTFLVSFFRLGRERIPAGLLIVIRDLTPVKELETALDSSNRLARLGTLISGLAHQLRSPLNGMNMRLELLRHEAGDAGARHIDKLRKEITRLNEAVEALLRFMRPEQLNLSDFSINEMLKELGARVASDRISVEYELDPSLPPVRADRGLIYEALSNLITNADQAMAEGGVLKLSSFAQGSSVEVVIADKGPGISEEQLDRIFDLYYTTKAGGSGLGLPFAMRAIELNGGKIAIDSQLGQGTACRVTIPIASDALVKSAVSSAA
ncbi:ATP-binding protein [Candidatus Binatus sp.]|uniref:sensor histidine kinase n=1 Tax=Candidatus Binatus sp. TaxID=2811406 RepID=UPI003CC651F9